MSEGIGKSIKGRVGILYLSKAYKVGILIKMWLSYKTKIIVRPFKY